MRFVFYAYPGRRFDEAPARAFVAGCRAVGILSEIRDVTAWDGTTPGDVGIVVGVKPGSKPVFDAYRKAGRHSAIFDKGYTRISVGPLNNLYWRMSFDAFQPHAYAHVDRPDDRWAATGVQIATKARTGPAVVFAGSSQKFCDWHSLGSATDYARTVLDSMSPHLREGQRLVYRPKPSWPDKQPVPGYGYSEHPRSFSDELKEAGCVVTYGSNATFEAVLRGYAAITLGDGIARLCSRRSVRDVARAAWPGADAVARLARSVAYCQWTLDEMEVGMPALELADLVRRFRSD